MNEFLNWNQIDAVWDIDHECKGKTAQEAYDMWQAEIAMHPDCGMNPTQWDLEDFKMYINWLNKQR